MASGKGIQKLVNKYHHEHDLCGALTDDLRQ